MSFLRKLFGGKKESKTIELSIDKLEDWLASNCDFEYWGLRKKYKEFISLVRETEILLDVLDKSNVEEEADIALRQRVLDNKNSYVNNVRIFLRKIKIGSDINPDSIIEYCKMVISELNNLNSNTSKSFYFTQLLFKTESAKLVGNLKRIDVFIKNLKELAKGDKVSLVGEISNKIKELKDGIKNKAIFSKELKTMEENLEELKISLTGYKEELKNKKEGEEFLKFDSLKKEREKIKSDVNNLRSEVIHLLSPLNRAFRKYQKIEDSTLVNNYIDSSLNLFSDNNLSIIDLLKKLEKSILDNSLELKDDEKEKTLKLIENVEERKIRELYEKNISLKSRLREVEIEIFGSKISRAIEELDYNVVDAEKSLRSKAEEIVKLRRKLDNLMLDEIKDELEQSIKKVVNKEVKIQPI